jgi:hypothetical protein
LDKEKAERDAQLAENQALREKIKTTIDAYMVKESHYQNTMKEH